VTGAASGIGRAVAQEAAARGYDALLIDRSEDVLSEAIETLSCPGANSFGRVADVTDLDSLISAVMDTRGIRAPRVGAQEFTASCASMHGVIGLMRSAAFDYGPRGVRINALAPAFVETPMADRIFDCDEDERDFCRSAAPLARFAQPFEVAKAVLHLLSDEASYTNGHVYRIDGGSTAGYIRQPS
jgi:NAD(P)-dependent dehydrogenase (short-subunit alcohol dehydrogenase family)